MRLIDADEAIKSAIYGNSGPIIYRQYAVKVLKDAPTVDAVEVVHGKWELEHETYGVMRCSVCKKECPLEKSLKPDGWRKELLYIHSDYCPWCGAKMDGGKENE